MAVFSEITEIKGAIHKFTNDTTFIKLRSRWNTDFDLYRLKPYDGGSGYYSYTSNAPRNLITRGVSMLVESQLMFRMHEELLNDEERNTANNNERLYYGAVNINNEINLRMVDSPSILDQMAWHAVVRGGFAELVYVYKHKKTNDTIPRILIWDLYNTAYGVTDDGVSWAAYTRKATKEQVKEEYGIDTQPSLTNNLVDVIDYWDDENNGIIVNSQWAKKLEPHGLDACPIYIIKAGSMPAVWQDRYEYTGTHLGESILSANRDLYPITNKTMSDLLTIVRRGVKVPLGFWSRGGQRTLDEDIWQVDKAAVVPMDIDAGEKIEPLIQPSMPADYGNLLNTLSGEEQRGGLSHLAQGTLGFRLSGFAVNQVNAFVYTTVAPYATCIEQGMYAAAVEIANQFAKGNWKPLMVRGRTSKGRNFGVPQAIQISPNDINADWRPEVTLEIVLPKDDAQRYQLARLATEGERPLMSIKSAQEELIGVQDTSLESEHIMEEWANILPTVRLYKAFQSALAQGHPDVAMNILAELQKLTGGQPQPGAGGQQGAPQLSPQQLLSMQEQGVGVPGGETGLSSDVMPPEAMGGLPSGARGAQLSLFGEEG